MKMFYVGNLVNAVEVSFKNKETGNVNISKKLQFLEKNDKGIAELIDIKLDEKEDISKFTTSLGKEITINISVKLINGKLYYSHIPESKISIK